MSQAGKILDITEGDYHLVVVGARWGLVQLSTGKILSQGGADNHAAAKTAALMSARVYAPDFHMSECYRRYRDELLEATTQDKQEFREWFRERHQEVVNGFLDTFGNEPAKFQLEDLIAHARRQYARFLGQGV